MPFQVVFNTVQIPLPPVVLLTAGDVLNVACGTTVTLTGVVDKPENLPGHTIEWVQLDGVPVTLSDPNSLITSYAFTERSDKLFRLFIDRGTPEEQFKDVFVFHTPTSVANLKLPNAAYKRNIPAADFVECSTITGELTLVIGHPSDTVDRTPCSSTGEKPTTGIDFDFTISWVVPTAKPELIPHFLDSQLFYADTDTIASPRYTDPPGSTVTHSFFPGGENELKRYYILTRYNVSGNIIEGKSCIVDYTTIQIPAVHVIDDKTTIKLGNSGFERVNYGNIFEKEFSNSIISLANVGLNVNRFDNKGEFTESNGILSLSNAGINIIRYDPSGIGS